MKKSLYCLILFLCSFTYSFCQSAGEISVAAFSVQEEIDFIVNSGKNKIILSDIREPDQIRSGFRTEIREGENLIETPDMLYTEGEHFALLNIKDKGLTGTVKLRVYLDDFFRDITIHIKVFRNPGITMDFYDIVFWQQTNPIQTNAASVYSELLTSAHVPGERDKTFWGENYEKWEMIFPKITIAGNCVACNPDPIIDMATSSLKGFFIPPRTGNYIFSFAAAEAAGGVFIDTTCTSWAAAKAIAFISDNGNAGVPAQDGKGMISEPVFLQEGKVYPIYAERWFIHLLEYGIKVSGPGIEEQYIPAELLAPSYDVIKPEIPQNVKIVTISDKSVRLAWTAVSHGAKIARIAGYNIYANGVRMNADVIENTVFQIEGLSPETIYDLFVCTVDELGNESEISKVVVANTLKSSTIPPDAPTSIMKIKATGETLKVTWKGADASGSVPIAYDVYVDNVLYNTDDKIFTDTILIRGLKPETSYGIQVVAYNGSWIASEKSTVKYLSTGEFDPMDESGLEFGEYRARVNIEKRNVSWNWGFGLNAPFKDGSLFENNGNNTFNRLVRNYHLGALRWGGLDANEYAFEKATGPDSDRAFISVGSSVKHATHADNMNFVNEIGAYYALCIGTKDGNGGLSGGSGIDYTVDYISDPKTFLNLIEYLAGPMNSPYGRVRTLEGYSEPLLAKGKSKGLILEFGNEVWGADAHNAPIGKDYLAYGQWCRRMADTIRTSPYWNDIKDLVYMVYSARNPHSGDSYGLNEQVIKGDRGEVNTLGTAGYLGGDFTYNPEFTDEEQVYNYYERRQQQMKRNLEGLQIGMKNQIIETGAPLYTYFYEAQASTSSYFGNLGQGVILNDYLTASMRYGSIVPSIYGIDGGEWRITLNDGTPLAHYAMASLINRYCKGHIVSSDVETNNTLMIRNSSWIPVPLLDYDPIGASVYNQGTKWSILLFSRDFHNDYTVQLNLPEGVNPKATSGTRYLISGDDPSVRETFTADTLENLTISDGMLVKVPKYSMVLYTFEGDDPRFDALPLGYFDRVKCEQLEIAGNRTIEEPKGITKLTPKVSPDNAFLTTVKWELLNETEVAPAFTMSVNGLSELTLRATGACSGKVRLRAYVADNPSVNELVEIDILNQGSSCCGTCVGMDDTDGEKQISVYPNPAYDVIYIGIPETGFTAQRLGVYNPDGIRFMSETVTSGSVTLDISHLVAGTYFLVVQGKEKTETIPFVKK
ncbi:MAG: T9SS type A sorting domain-containing protein [Bacteroidales bacterium]|nr:T9SS type A sorting domain-containing protein [Bacteroidales bacterium]